MIKVTDSETKVYYLKDLKALLEMLNKQFEFMRFEEVEE